MGGRAGRGSRGTHQPRGAQEALQAAKAIAAAKTRADALAPAARCVAGAVGPASHAGREGTENAGAQVKRFIPVEPRGVMVTLAALCLADALDMHRAGEAELARIWTKVEQIRAKQASKPKGSPLPQLSSSAS